MDDFKKNINLIIKFIKTYRVKAGEKEPFPSEGLVKKNIISIIKTCRAKGGEKESFTLEGLELGFQWDILRLDEIERSYQELPPEELRTRTANLSAKLPLSRKVPLTELRKLSSDIIAWINRFPLILPEVYNDLQEFVNNLRDIEQTLLNKTLIDNRAELVSLVPKSSNVSFQPLQYGREQIIFSSRRVPSGSTPENIRFFQNMYKLAVALTIANIGLLPVISFFYQKAANEILFVQKLPENTTSTTTLQEEIIRGLSFCNVEGRLKLAHKLAEAVFFLHTAGFVHRNITSRSVVCIQQSVRETQSDVDDSYLIGYELIQRVSDKEDVADGNGIQRGMWDFKVYQHPDRLKKKMCPRYINTHDVYSLGVVLLEVGCRKQLRTVAVDLTKKNPEIWRTELLKIVMQIDSGLGEQYKALVAWCLGLKGDHIVTDIEFRHQVLDPLKAIVWAL